MLQLAFSSIDAKSQSYKSPHTLVSQDHGTSSKKPKHRTTNTIQQKVDN